MVDRVAAHLRTLTCRGRIGKEKGCPGPVRGKTDAPGQNPS
jgi:hypothetical protein